MRESRVLFDSCPLCFREYERVTRGKSIKVVLTIKMTRRNGSRTVSRSSMVHTRNNKVRRPRSYFIYREDCRQKKIEKSTVILCVGYSVSDNDDTTISVEVDGEKVDDKAAKEIDKRIKDSSLLFLYNSTTRHDEFFFGRGRRHIFRS